MKPQYNYFKESIEHDMYSHTEELNFIEKFDIVSMELDSADLRLYKLKSGDETCLLEVTKRKPELTASANTWHTEKYSYRMIKD